MASVPAQALPELTDIGKIAGGFAHVCALTTGGVAKCWGNNGGGQLGDNTVTSRLTPVAVLGLGSGVSAMAPGADHTCALAATGGVKCWGYNTAGELGDNSTAQRLTPVDVSGLTSGVTSIAAGFGHTCALTAAGGVKCWGNNFLGELGDNSTTNRLAPVDVSGLTSGVTSIAAGFGHACAITAAGGVKCWGSNVHGQLGDNTTTSRLTPVDVSGLASGVAGIALGQYHTCALTTTGGVKCWGYNASGQLGDNSTTDRLTPVDVSGLASGVAAIAAGDTHTCALTTSGGMKCWGNNQFGLLGDNSTAFYRSTPVDVFGLTSGVAGMAAGDLYTCAVTTTGGVRCWGYNDLGQLGDNTRNNHALPAPVLTFTPPDPPTISSATPGNGRATIAFTAPSNDGGSPITGYAVTCNAGGFSAMGTASPITVTGLANATTYSCSVTATNAVGAGAASGVVAVTPSSDLVVQSLSTNPQTTLDFGGQSMGTTSPPIAVIVSNSDTSAVSISSVTISSPSLPAQFSQTNNCASLAAGASCTVNLTFSPAVTSVGLTMTSAVSGTLTIASDGLGSPNIVNLAGTAEKSLVTHYYRSILRRAPDSSGATFWRDEAVRVQGLGANVNETWFAMAQTFYASAEYAAFARNDTDFVTDLYTTFFNRPPDGAGLTFWTGQLGSGLPREVALASFMFSTEFGTFTQAIFGNTAARAEVNVVVDFYRGLLSRLPDTPGFNFWVQQFRTAQCQGGAAVNTQVEAISSGFANGSEYAARSRTNAQYVGDLYNAFLRRGGDLNGVQFWINQIATGAQTRDAVRKQFVASTEFQGRVAAVINQGCMP